MSVILPHLVRSNDKVEHALLSAWLNVAEVGMCAIDSSSKVVMLNRSACKLLGVQGLDMLDQPISALVGDLNGGQSLLQWLKSPGADGERHVSRQTLAGISELLIKSTTLENVAGVAETGHVTILAITDVTLLLAAQRRIDSEGFRRQWQALNAGVVISDARSPAMPIIYVNPTFEHISGYASAEVLGRNCRFLQAHDIDQPGLASIRQAIREQTNGYAKLRNYRKDGSMFINELFISPVKDVSGEITHFVGIQHLQADPDHDERSGRVERA